MFRHVVVVASLMGWGATTPRPIAKKRPPKHRPAISCILTNGDRISGTLVSVRHSRLRLATRTIGIVTLARKTVAQCQTSDLHTKRSLSQWLLPAVPSLREPMMTIAPLPVTLQLALQMPLPIVPLPVEALNIEPVAVPLAARALPTYKPTVGWKRTMGFSFALARGNSNSSDLGFTGGIVRRTPRSQLSLTARRFHGQQNGQTSSDFFSSNLRDDHAIGKLDSTALKRPSYFAETTFERDALAKLDRRVLANTGLSIPLSGDPTNNVALEIGAGLTHEKYSTNVSRTRVGGVLRLAGSQKFGLANANQQLAAYPDLNDVAGRYRLNGDFNLGAPLSKRVALTVGWMNRYDTRPQFQVKKLDYTIQSGLSLEF